MNPTLENAKSTISRILSDAAFIFTDELDDSAKPSGDNWDADGVSLQFFGVPAGELHMWVSKGFACYAAANMLGLDDGSDEARKKGIDALKELLNMIVGNFITAAFGDKPVFDLGLPKDLTKEVMVRDFANANAIWLEAEGNPILFTVDVLDK